MLVDIGQIEYHYKSELSNLEEWNYLRNHYRSYSEKEEVQNPKSVVSMKTIKDIFYGFKNWFRRYDYLIFSDSSERRYMKESFYDIRVDYIINYLGKNKTLCIETPINIHYKNVKTKYITSRRAVDFLTIIGGLFVSNRCSFEILDKIHEENKLKIKYNKIIRRFRVQYGIYKCYFKLIQPKYIFLNCFYDKQYVIKAAHDLNIQVIDIQHGVIGTEHSAYNSDLLLDCNYLPDYLFVNGLYDKNNFLKSKLFKQDNIFPIGSDYLEFLSKNFQKDIELGALLDKFRISVGVSLQWTIEREMIDAILRVAPKLPDVIFILIARKYDRSKYVNFKLPTNVIFNDRLDCYNVILHCNYHCTVYSTCALESPSLGIKNILFNINNNTEKYMPDMVKDGYTLVVNTDEELVKVLDMEYVGSKNQIIENNKQNFIKNYKQNISRAIEYIKAVL